MIVYVETNFILELALEQEQHVQCEAIVSLCEHGRLQIFLPNFAIAECYDTLIRRTRQRESLTHTLAQEIQQLARSKPYKNKALTLQTVMGLLVQSVEEEKERLNTTIEKLLNLAETISLDRTVIASATHFQKTVELLPQDAIIYASIVNHLQQKLPEHACFLNKNSRDFDNPLIVDTLAQYHCKMLFSFEHGDQYLNAVLNSSEHGGTI